MKSEWHERLAAFKKYYGYKNADLARMSGNTLQSVKNISQGEVPGWLRFAIQVWENECVGGKGQRAVKKAFRAGAALAMQGYQVSQEDISRALDEYLFY